MKHLTKHNLALVALVLPLMSLFLYAGFDITWWIETESPSFREFLLVIMHMITFAGGAFILIIEQI